MTVEALENRMEQLEQQVAQLTVQLLRLNPQKKDWKRTVGKFQDNPVSREADKLGEEYRRSMLDN